MPSGIKSDWLTKPQDIHKENETAMFLREHERKRFTDRKEILAILHQNAEQINKGEGTNLAIVGQRRIGKTMIVERFADDLFELNSPMVPVYFNIANNISVPSVFAIRLLSSIGHSFIQANERTIEQSGGILNTDDLLVVANQTREAVIISTAQRVAKEMEKDKPDERMLLETTLSCLGEIAQQTGRKPLVIFDEFHSVTQLDNFPNIKETLSVVGPILSQQIEVGYIVASSNATMLEDSVQSETSPFFNQFEIIQTPPFSWSATSEFCTKSLPEQLVTSEIIARLFEFTAGHPFYLNCLTTAMRQLYREKGSDDLLDRAIYEDILFQEGRIHQYCQYRVETTLAEARGKTTLRSVLLVLGETSQLTLSEIAAQLKRSPGEVRSYLKRLADFDLIGREGRHYFITDPIIALWIKFTILEKAPEFIGFRDIMRYYQGLLAKQATQ
jgi:uncharacterized protein